MAHIIRPFFDPIGKRDGRDLRGAPRRNPLSQGRCLVPWIFGMADEGERADCDAEDPVDWLGDRWVILLGILSFLARQRSEPTR